MSHKMKNRRHAGKHAPTLKRIFEGIDITDNLCEMLDTLVITTVKSRLRSQEKTARFDVSSWINRNYDPHEQVLWLLESRVSASDIRQEMEYVNDIHNRAEKILGNIKITNEALIAMYTMISDRLHFLAKEQSCKKMNDLEILVRLAGEKQNEITSKEPGEQVQWLIRNGWDDNTLERILSNAYTWLREEKNISQGDILAMSCLSDPNDSSTAKTGDIPEPA